MTTDGVAAFVQMLEDSAFVTEALSRSFLPRSHLWNNRLLCGVGAGQVRVLFVVDDWNALYWPTKYFEWLSATKQRNVLPLEIRLAVAVSAPPPLSHTLNFPSW